MAEKKSTITIDDEIERLLTEMKKLEIGSEEYARAVDNIKILKESQSYQKPLHTIPWEPIIVAGTALIQTVLILHYEVLRTIPSKALGFILKGRL